jgi:hypothetical protein
VYKIHKITFAIPYSVCYVEVAVGHGAQPQQKGIL